MLKRIAFGFAISLYLPMAAGAQSDPVREEGDRACGPDAKRFCRSVLNQGDFAILSCLQTNAPRLKPICQQFLRKQGQL